MVNLTLRNKLQWNVNRSLYIFIQQNAFENVVWKMAAILCRPQCVNTNSKVIDYIVSWCENYVICYQNIQGQFVQTKQFQNVSKCLSILSHMIFTGDDVSTICKQYRRWDNKQKQRTKFWTLCYIRSCNFLDKCHSTLRIIHWNPLDN